MSKLKRYTGQDDYTFYERGGNYKQREESTTADSLRKNYQEFEARQQRYLKSVEAQSRSQAENLQADINNTEQVNKNIQALSNMVGFFGNTATALTSQVLKQQQEDGYNQMQRLLDSPLDPDKQADYDSKRSLIMGTAEEVDKVGVEATKSGVPLSALEMLNNSTGRRAVGMREAYALHMGQTFQQKHQMMLSQDNETELIDKDGATFTPVEVDNDPTRAQIVFEHAARDIVMNDEGMLGLSEGTQEIAMAPIRKYRQEYMKSLLQEHVKELKAEARVEAENELTVSLSKSTPDLMGWQRAVLMAQRRGGLSPSKAREKMLELAYVIAINQNNPDLVSQIGSTVIESTGQRVDVAYAGDFQRVANKVGNMQRDLNKQAIEADRTRGYIDASELLQALGDDPDGITDSEIEAAMQQWQQNNPTLKMDPRLKEFRDNQTLQARDEKDQEQEVIAGLVEGTMTEEVLKSGKYSPKLVLKYEARASKNTEQTAVIRAKSTTAANDSVKRAVEAKADLGVDDKRDASVPLAIGAAQTEVARRASVLLSSETFEVPAGRERVEYAYEQAAQAVVAEIEGGKGRFASNGQLGVDFEFPAFSRGELAQIKVERAQQEMSRVRSTVIGGGVASVKQNTNNIYTEAEANATDSQVVQSKAQRIANTLTNSGKPTTGEQVLQMMRDKYGVKSDKPVYADKYAENAMGAGLIKYLNSGTSSGHNLVAAQANLLPVHIRPGYQHYRDVINAANYFKFPPHLLPLVAATYGLESGWGQYPSGNNNVFNIKGRGTVVEGSEYRDYRSVQESIGDFVELMKDPRYKKVMSAKTPMEAAIEMKNAGYAEDPLYIEKMRAVFGTMGLDPDSPYDNKPRTKSQWSNPALMSPVAQFRVIEHLSGDWSHHSYRVDHGGSNYHEHLAFSSPEEAMAAAAKLNAAGIKTTELKGVNPVGGHSPNSYHYTGQAFDVPADQVPEGEEQMLSLRVRQILGIK